MESLLTYYGYEIRDREYVFESATSPSKRELRRNAAKEVEDLLADLGEARDGSLRGFDEFIGVCQSIELTYRSYLWIILDTTSTSTPSSCGSPRT